MNLGVFGAVWTNAGLSTSLQVHGTRHGLHATLSKGKNRVCLSYSRYHWRTCDGVYTRTSLIHIKCSQNKAFLPNNDELAHKLRSNGLHVRSMSKSMSFFGFFRRFFIEIYVKNHIWRPIYRLWECADIADQPRVTRIQFISGSSYQWFFVRSEQC